MTLTNLYNWRVYCTDLDTYATTTSATAPTVCPIDGSGIDPTATVILSNEFENVQKKGYLKYESLAATGPGVILSAPNSHVALRSSNVFLSPQPEPIISNSVSYTLTPSNLFSGMIIGGGTSKKQLFTLPTAAVLLAALPNAQVNDAFNFTLIPGTYPIQLIPSTGSSIVGEDQTLRNTSGLHRVRIVSTSSAQYVVYRIA